MMKSLIKKLSPNNIHLYLHIGTEKTGTTTIQDFLYINRENFSKDGYYVPTSIGIKNNRDLVTILLNDPKKDHYLASLNINTNSQIREYKNKIRDGFFEEIRTMPNNIENVVISSEHFHSRFDDINEIKSLSKMLKKIFSSVTIVAYIRDQVSVAESLYTTVLRSGNAQTFDSYIKNQISNKHHYYDYNKMLTMWEGVFGRDNIKLNVFEKSSFFKNDLLNDFMKQIDLNLDERYKIPARVNESCNHLGQLLLRSVNDVVPNFNENGFDVSKSQLLNMIGNAFKGKGETLNSIDAKLFMKNFNDGNEEIRKRYFPEKKRLFKQQDSKEEPLRATSKAQDEIIALVIAKLYFKDAKIFPDHYADSLRDAALLLENTDMNLSYELMKMAGIIRPNGPLINKKLVEYGEIISVQ